MKIETHEVTTASLKVKRPKKEKLKEPKDIRHMFRKLLAALDITAALKERNDGL